ncbi:hypothetical protein [Streptomyces sp. NPDC059371]|uniref:hypothetical protein n=1 Tax=Streptomyces sp. NPDC059371 TaxID=3346812 RepID=UPI0036B5A50E
MNTRTPTGNPGATTAPGPSRNALLNNPYSLSLREIRAEIRRCAANGWQLWEIRLRFTPNREDRST